MAGGPDRLLAGPPRSREILSLYGDHLGGAHAEVLTGAAPSLCGLTELSRRETS
jgi:hypothetical protein